MSRGQDRFWDGTNSGTGTDSRTRSPDPGSGPGPILKPSPGPNSSPGHSIDTYLGKFCVRIISKHIFVGDIL